LIGHRKPIPNSRFLDDNETVISILGNPGVIQVSPPEIDPALWITLMPE